ncbi:hypothetical protein IVB11_29920 [Bradyrhizobium sp. 177]|uniref:hypothetical protein n=1 Tax=Bradyrhizobium sp. 177 TaxID=2782647 RepID=UPI001FF806D7|nr:hypothetical protein [Bradyrhizobium sp. 177]MCK1553144.1 hypothetical protein [Bradyrhizobium sp. 177]
MPRKRTSLKPLFEAEPGKVRLRTLNDLDGRTAAAQKAQAFVERIEADLGGADRLSTAQRTLVTRAAVTAAIVEAIEAGALMGGDIDVGAYVALTNNLRRFLTTLGLERVTRDVTPRLAEYIAKPPPGAT